MGYQYSDAEMMVASEISYLNIQKDMPVGKAVDQYLKYGKCINGKWVLNEQYKNDPELERQFQVAVEIKELGEKYAHLGIDWRNWKIVDRCDDLDATGYYGCLIDKGDGSAIIANRGTEPYGEQLKKDLIETDLGLLDAESTGQHDRAERYMEELYYKYGEKYNSFGLTGHSLGGNLSQHMMIHAPAEMRDKIDRCLSLDGPGFSKEYIEKNRHLIEKVNDRMDHYQWSFISSLLIPLPGVNPMIIEAHDGKGLIDRHSLNHVDLDDYGTVQPGDKHIYSKIVGPVVEYLEYLGEDPILDALSLRFLSVIAYPVLVYKLVREVAEIAYQVTESVKEKIESIYYDYIAPNVSGEYEIRLSSVASYEVELRNAQKQLEAVADEIRTISRTWKNWSSSGAYYRSQLNIIKNGLEADARVLSSLAQVTENIVEDYYAADHNVSNLFSW